MAIQGISDHLDKFAPSSSLGQKNQVCSESSCEKTSSNSLAGTADSAFSSTSGGVAFGAHMHENLEFPRTCYIVCAGSKMTRSHMLHWAVGKTQPCREENDNLYFLWVGCLDVFGP